MMLHSHGKTAGRADHFRLTHLAMGSNVRNVEMASICLARERGGGRVGGEVNWDCFKW